MLGNLNSTSKDVLDTNMSGAVLGFGDTMGMKQTKQTCPQSQSWEQWLPAVKSVGSQDVSFDPLHCIFDQC